MTNFVLIDPAKIYPNPLNPRKVVGDIDELTDSIRIYGVLQNLTIVPYDPQIHTGLTVEDPNNAYCAVIGHRRRAAAIAAGLSAVPCVIDTGMNAATQVSVMLLENAQREDLTPYEEAQGYQMLLDLGESEASIATMTGFSTKTIQRRLKLLVLDKDKFAAAAERGATLSDYAELDKITDPDLKNMVLDTIGTPNFAGALKSAVATEKKRKYLADVLRVVDTFATEISSKDDVADIHYLNMYAAWYQQKVTIPTDLDSVKYYYTVKGDDTQVEIRLYSDAPAVVSAKEQKERQHRDFYNKHLGVVKEATNRAYELRADFVRNLSNAVAKAHLSSIVSFYAIQTSRHYGKGSYVDFMDDELLAELLEIPNKELDDQKIRDAAVRCPEYALLCSAYAFAERKTHSYYSEVWSNETVSGVSGHILQYSCNDRLDELYDFLEKLGYEPSDEEKSLINGNHPSLLAFDMDEAAEASA